MKSIQRVKFLAGVAAAICGIVSTAPSAGAAYIAVYGGPTYDETTRTGFRSASMPVNPGSTAGNGIAVGYAAKYAGGTFGVGELAIRWDASGAAVTELGTLGTNSRGFTSCHAYAVNTAGTAVGYADKFSGDTDLGKRAVRWDVSGTAATELGNLGTSNNGHAQCAAYAINSAGVAVGVAYFGSGDRAVRWDASGTAATELANLGTDPGGYGNSHVWAINTAGTAVGASDKYTGDTYLGVRAVRWAASGTAATELGNLGTSSSGWTTGDARAINTAGVAVGNAYRWNGTTSRGSRAVRWDASGTAATELANLGTDPSGYTDAFAMAINTAGTSVGHANKYTGGTLLGSRAVRWDASGTAATELGNLGTDSGGATNSDVVAINIAGVAVGYAQKYSGGALVGLRTVLWNADTAAVDLNSLIDPSSGWTLTQAAGISDTNWVTGIGSYDPDGPGPLAAYDRAFLLDVSSAVPEPSNSLMLLSLCAAPLLGRRRRSAQAYPSSLDATVRPAAARAGQPWIA